MSNTLGEYLEKVEGLIEYCDDRDFKEAVSFVNQYADDCEKNSTTRKYEILANLKYRLIEAFADYGTSPKAEVHLKYLCELHERLGNHNITKVYAEALAYLAGDGYLMGEDENPDRASELQNLLKDLMTKNPKGGLEEDLINCYADFVSYHLRNEDVEEADMAFKEMTDLYSSCIGDENVAYLYIRTLSRWVEFYAGQDDYELANEWFDTMLHISDYADGSIILTISGTIDTLVGLNIKHKQIQKAEELCKDHQGLLTKSDNERTISILQYRMAEILINLFNYYVLDKNIEIALVKYSTLKEMEERLGDADVAECYARAVYAVAIHFLDQYNFKEAVKYKEELKRLYEKYEKVRNDLISYLSTVLRGMASNSEESGDASFREDALRELKRLMVRETAETVKYNYAVALADLVCIGMKKNHQTYQGHYLEELKKLIINYPEIKSLKEEYARALLFVADRLTDKEESLEFIRLAVSMPQPWNKDTFNSISRNLYNETVKLSDAKKLTDAEEWHKLHTNLIDHPDVPGNVIVRQAKQLYNLHFDYSEKGDFGLAEEKYQALKDLYRKYEASPITNENNPLGLEIAERVVNTARNYVIDLKNQTPKKSFSLFGSPQKKAAKRIKQLQEDASLLVAKWKDCATPVMLNSYHQIRAIKL